jgi:uncharacterized protein (TIGR02117 family)
VSITSVKKRARRFLGVVGKTVLRLLAVVLLYGLTAFSLSRISVNDSPNKGNIAIFVRTNGVHTDIVVPAKTEIIDWTSQIKYEQTKSGDTAQYLAFGWGDRDFYLNTPTWADLKFSTAFNAAFYLGSAIVHTQYENALRESETCKKIMISEADYTQLVTYLSNAFQTDSLGNVIWIAGSGYENHDTFYLANGKYSLFKTCNTWTNSALKAANQKAALWTVTDTGLMTHYE